MNHQLNNSAMNDNFNQLHSFHLKKIAILLFGSIYIGYLILIDDGIHHDMTALSLSLYLSLFSFFYAIQIDGMPYSLNKIFYIFTLFFIGIAPALQYKNGISFWGGDVMTDIQFLDMNILFSCITTGYFFLYYYFLGKKEKKESFSNSFNINSKKLFLYLFIASSLTLLAMLYFRNFHISSLFSRSSNFAGIDQGSSRSILLIVNSFLRPVPMISLFIYYSLIKKININFLLLSALVLLCTFPTGMPRYQTAALYLPLCILLFTYFSKNINFSLLLIAGLLVAFPLLHSIFKPDEQSSLFSSISTHMFLTANFDSFYNFFLAISNNFITYGRQLAGVLLFFVPRSIWPDKPVGSGNQLANNLDLDFSNISMNFFGEGYINFGYAGILLAVILLAYINATLDHSFWKKQNAASTTYLHFAYPFLLGMEFIVLRGDLMSSFAYTVGISIAIFLVYILVKLSGYKTEIPSSKNA